MKKIIMLVLFLILIGVSLIFLKNLFFPDDQEVLYGNRLDSVEGYEISEKDTVVNSLTSDSSITNATIRVQGTIINLFINISDTAINDAKGLATTAIGLFSEETISLYDIQVFIVKNDSEETPVIGYKSKISEGITWSN